MPSGRLHETLRLGLQVPAHRADQAEAKQGFPKGKTAATAAPPMPPAPEQSRYGHREDGARERRTNGPIATITGER